MQKISIRKIAEAVEHDIHEDIPTKIMYEGEEYYRTSSMINFVNSKTDELLRIDLLDLHYDLYVDVVDNEEKIEAKKTLIKELREKIDKLESEIDKLED